jgi:LysM repeat protein
MENNDSNIKPQQTGGLKLMTVFIFVLALHVVVIGGFTVYHLMSGGSTDADLTTTDKTHKDLKSADGSAVADATTTDASQGDKSAPSTPTATPSTEVAAIPQTASGPANSTAPAPDTAAPTITPEPAPAPALAPASSSAPTTTAPLTSAPSTEVVDQGTLTSPTASELAPPPEPAPITPTPAPSVSPAAGPVHMPPAVASAPVHEHEQIYTVKITDSYKKIAHAHHITVAQLKEANGIKGNVLHTGQKLVIPSTRTLVAESPATPAAAFDSAPTGSEPSESVTPMTASLASAPSTAASPVLHHHLYTVVKGDTLTKIARKFKTTPTALMTENNITDPTKLSIGKKLKIPSEDSRSARNSAPASSTQPSQVQAKENAPSAQLANFVP